MSSPMRQFRLIAGPVAQPVAVLSPTMRVYRHWLFMFGKNPARCGLGPLRRRALDAWLTVYDEETPCLAFEGAAADAWIAEQGGHFTAPEWILKDEANIERFAEVGERLREAAAAAESAAATAPSQASATVPEDPAIGERFRARLKAIADARAGRG